MALCVILVSALMENIIFRVMMAPHASGTYLTLVPSVRNVKR